MSLPQQQQEKAKSRSRSKTPPPTSSKKHHRREKSGRKNHHVEFSPISSTPRRGSSASGGGVTSLVPHGKLDAEEVRVNREKQKRLEMVARARDRREAMLKRVRREKKIMLFSSILAFVAQFVWFAAVFTDHWFYVTLAEDENTFNSTDSITLKSADTAEVFLNSNTGLWKTCGHFLNLKTLERREQCSYFSIFLTLREEANRGLLPVPATLNEHVIEYTRAQICFASISVLLMTMTIISAFYTFKNSRYVYKRLAACLYFMTTISILVVLEVLVTSVHYAMDHKLYSEGATVKYGFSFYMGWSVFLVYLVNGCIFLILSRKRKYDKDDDADGDLIMGR